MPINGRGAHKRPAEITRLLERYDAQREAYQSGQYKETEIRVEFTDPFFKALGWDVHNERGYAEAYKDVIHEDALKIGGATEAPDSCFRIVVSASSSSSARSLL